MISKETPSSCSPNIQTNHIAPKTIDEQRLKINNIRLVDEKIDSSKPPKDDENTAETEVSSCSSSDRSSSVKVPSSNSIDSIKEVSGGSTSTNNSAIVSPTSNKKRGQHKSVQFSQVIILEHNTILGDNVPSSGAPITIDWKPTYTHTHSVDDYEYEITHSYHNSNTTTGVQRNGRHRKSKEEMKLTQAERDQLLLSKGYTKQEVRRASMQAQSKREQRKWTKDTPDMQPVEELVERGFRALKKPFRQYGRRHSSPWNLSLKNQTGAK